MRTIPLLALLSLSCTEGGATLPSTSPAALPTAQAPAAADFRLSVVTAAAGTSGTITATRAPAGARIDFLFSRTGFAEQCPAFLNGACINLTAPVTLLGSATADAAGVATLSFFAPLAAGDRRYGLQAIVRGNPALVSNAVRVWVAPQGTPVDPNADLDGDGFTPNQGDCDDGAAAVFPGAADPRGDGLDTSCDGVDGVDADGDRVASVASGGTDCDDGDAATYPGAPEACDGADDDCDGILDEGFPDGDGSGRLDCLEVATIITWGAQRAQGLGFWTCDNMGFVDREVQELTDTLNEMGLGLVRIDEHEIDGVDPAALAPYRAIVVASVGWPDELRDRTVDALLAFPDKPLLFAGDDTGLVVDRTEQTTGRSELRALTGITAALDNGSGAYKGLGANLVDPDADLVQGPWGPVGSFAYAGDMDHVALDGRQGVVFLKDQVDTPVVWVQDDARPTAVILPSLYTTNTCPLYVDPADGLAARRLYQNTLSALTGLP